ncbi:MAG: Fe-S cluster assembly ATPase SufC [Nitrospirota bacterium]
MQEMLKVEDLWVSVDNRQILKGVNLSMNYGEVHMLFGPNASGKTTLIMSVVGYPNYKVASGKILFNGTDITRKPIYERAKLGISVAFQTSPEIRGVKLRDLIRLSAGKEAWDSLNEPVENFATPILNTVGLDPMAFRDRDVNVGFSGGEKKRSELAQVFAMKPKLMILDEPDSGVDIDSLKMIGNRVSQYARENRCGVLVVTHYRHILPYIKPDVAHVMCGGVVVVTGEPYEIFSKIEEKGYCAYIDICPPATKALLEKEGKPNERIA